MENFIIKLDVVDPADTDILHQLASPLSPIFLHDIFLIQFFLHVTGDT